MVSEHVGMWLQVGVSGVTGIDPMGLVATNVGMNVVRMWSPDAACGEA